MKILKAEKKILQQREKDCPEGYHICPETGKCVKIGTRREAINLPSRLGKEVPIPPLAGSKLPDKPTTKELLKNNAEFYVQRMTKSGDYGVFDTHSGFCWATPPTKQAAEKKAKELNDSLKKANAMVTAASKYFKIIANNKYEKKFLAAIRKRKNYEVPTYMKLPAKLDAIEKKIESYEKKGKDAPDSLYAKQDDLVDDWEFFEYIGKWDIDTKKQPEYLIIYLNMHVMDWDGKKVKPNIVHKHNWSFVKVADGFKEVSDPEKPQLLKDADEVYTYMIFYTVLGFVELDAESIGYV